MSYARGTTDRGRKTSLLALCTKEVESLSMLKEEKRDLRHKGHLRLICKGEEERREDKLRR